MKLVEVGKYFIVWQAALVLIAAVGLRLLPLRKTYIGIGTQTYLTNPLLYSRANFDGNHYLGIARNGYGYAQEAFFPFYPKLIKLLAPFLNNQSVWAGVIISNLGLIMALWFLSRLINLDFSGVKTSLVLTVLLLFPTSFYFGAVYTESLFFALVVSSFYFARTRRWWLAGLLGALASYTRFVGIFLFPALLVELWLQYQEKLTNRKSLFINLLLVCLVPLGLLVYMYYLNQRSGDPLAFFHVQKLYGQFRGEKIILLYQVFWRYLKMILTVNRSDPLYLTILLEFATGLLFLVTSIYSLIKHRLSYAVFNACAYLVPTLTGSFVSLPRYVLVCFTSLVAIAQFLQGQPVVKMLYFTVSAVMLSIFTGLFFRGFWIG